MATTVTPRAAEQLHGVRADAAGGAVDQDGLPGPRVDRVDGRGRGGAGERNRGGGDEVEAGGLGHDGGGGQQRVLGERAGLDRRGEQHVPEHLVADGDMVDPGADGLDDAGGVAAEDDRVLVRHHPGQHAGGDGVVDGVETGGHDPHQHVPSVTSGVGTSDSCGCSPAAGTCSARMASRASLEVAFPSEGDRRPHHFKRASDSMTWITSGLKLGWLHGTGNRRVAGRRGACRPGSHWPAC